MSTKEKHTASTPSVSNVEGKSFIKENEKSLGFIALGIVDLGLLYFGYQQFYLAPRAEKATNEIFKAETYAQIDSLQKLAIKGDGSYPGFEQIAEEYLNTPSTNIANAYLGGLYLRQGQYQEAVNALKNYSSTGNPNLEPSIIEIFCDAYYEIKDYKQAISHYKKAAE